MKQGSYAKRLRGRGGPRRGNSSLRGHVIDSNGPDVKIRGNVYQVLEKYLSLARDAYSTGDRIASENLYQHAEHYFRVINATGGNPSQGRDAEAKRQGYNGGNDRLGESQDSSGAPSDSDSGRDGGRRNAPKEARDSNEKGANEKGAGETPPDASGEATETPSPDPEKGDSPSI